MTAFASKANEDLSATPPPSNDRFGRRRNRRRTCLGWNPGDPKHLDALYRDWWLLLNSDKVDEIHYLVQAGMPSGDAGTDIRQLVMHINGELAAEGSDKVIRLVQAAGTY